MPRASKLLFWIRLVTWLCAALGVGLALLWLLATVGCALTGGPPEPPRGMSIEQFGKWRETGQWWRDSVKEAVMLGGISVLVAIVVTVATLVWRDWNCDEPNGTI